MNERLPTKKSLGQHWLFDSNALDSIVEAASISASDNILEIGAGLGSLTEVLLTSGAQVTAVEFDKATFDQLKKEAQNWYSRDKVRLTILNQDILKFDLTTMPADYKVVANIPYYLTSHLIRILSESSNPPARCVLLVQKEVAERVAAKPGSMSLLSITAQFYWEVSLGQEIGRKLFTPPPKVDSQVLIMKRRTQPLLDVDQKQFFRLIKMGFAARRKTLLNSLSVGLQKEKAETVQLIVAAGLNPQDRPQQLSLENWGELYTKALPLL